MCPGCGDEMEHKEVLFCFVLYKKIVFISSVRASIASIDMLERRMQHCDNQSRSRSRLLGVGGRVSAHLFGKRIQSNATARILSVATGI